jgi:actin beta/gamma 1
MFPNLADRLTADLKQRRGGSSGVRVVEAQSAYGSWIGGSILASLSTMDQMMISKEDYDEGGPEMLNRLWPGGDVTFASGTLTKAARG